jgi:hypothetical protein
LSTAYDWPASSSWGSGRELQADDLLIRPYNVVTILP